MTDAAAILVAALAALAWSYLVFHRGGFWRLREWLPRAKPRALWPSVAVIMPARNEEATVATAVETVLGQRYPGSLNLILVDDGSTDATVAHAKAGAEVIGMGQHLTVVEGAAPPPGWTGKLWALEQGRRVLTTQAVPSAYIWLTDADISHAGHALERLVGHAEDDRRDLVSLMVRLPATGAVAGLLVPAFVFFFRKLYPFQWVNDPTRDTAGAAGGCTLVRHDALTAAGGFEAIRDNLIDDCALARAVKRSGTGRIWLGMTKWSHSLRPVNGLADVWRMVARTAYAQLDHSPVRLLATVLGMVVLYAVPPVSVATWPWHGLGGAAVPGAVAWALMALAFVPTLRSYEVGAGRAPALPLAGTAYTLMTLDSALRHALGVGGRWKGRTYTRRGRA